MRALLVLVMLARVAAAQPVDPAAKARADAAYAEGSSAYQAGDFSRAALRFEEAYSLVPDPAYLFNIGQAYRQAKECVKAAAAFSKYVELVPDAPNIANARSLLQEVKVCTVVVEGRRLMGAGRPAEACAKFELAYRADPAALATLLSLGACSEQIGKLASAAAWFRKAQKQAAAEQDEGAVAQAKQHLDAMAAKIPKIDIEVASGHARVKLDGVAIDVLVGVEVDPGRHAIELEPSTAHRVFEIALGEHKTVTIEVATGAARSNRAAYIVGGVGLSLWAGTAVLGFVAKAKYDDAATFEEQHEWKNLVRYGGTSMFVAGTAAVATSVVLYLRNRGRRTEPTAVAPSLGTNQVGLTVRGAF